MKSFKFKSNQEGAALLITIVVLLALTLLALASTNSNQNQAFMVRNTQFRFETFNASHSEIDGQIDYINGRKLSDGVPGYLLYLIDNLPGTSITSATSGGGTTVLPRYAAASTTYMTQSAEKEFRGPCTIFGEQLGAGSEKIRCNELEMTSNSQLTNSRIASEQHQIYEYKTLAQ